MSEILWRKFMDECVDNLQEVLLTVGINGLLFQYDRWLESEGYIKSEHGVYKSWKSNNHIFNKIEREAE